MNDLKNIIQERQKENKIVFFTIEGLAQADIDMFIDQPTDGLLYDLNMLPEVLLTNFDKRSVKEYASMLVIKRLKERLELI